MTVGINELRERLKRSGAREFLLTQLAGAGFTVGGWIADAKQGKFVRAFATVWSDQSETVRQLVHMTLNDFATGTPLTELSRSNFGNIRHSARRTEGPYKLTNASATPYTIEPGQLVLESTNGVQFVNTTGGLLLAATPGPTVDAAPVTVELPGTPAIPPQTHIVDGVPVTTPGIPATPPQTITVPGGPATQTSIPGELEIEIRALKAGAQGNVPDGSITRFVTPLAGVTGTNEAGVGGAPWYTTSGSDEEGVLAIRERNRTRITTLNQIAMPADGYKFLAMSVPGIERVKVDDTNPRGPNTIDIYIATGAGAAAATDLANVRAAISAKKSPHANVSVRAPVPRALNPAGVVHLAPGFSTKERRNEVLQAMADYVNSLPIGGVLLPPATSGVMPRSELNTALSQIPGVESVNLNLPALVLLTPLQLLVLGDTSGISFVPEPTA